MRIATLMGLLAALFLSAASVKAGDGCCKSCCKPDAECCKPGAECCKK